MKRILMMVVAAIMVTMNMNAQTKGDFDIRFLLGGNLSTLTNNSNAKQKVDWGTRVEADYLLSDKVAIAFEMNREYLGYKDKLAEMNVSLEYLGFNPKAKYFVKPWLSVYGGPQIAFLTRAKMEDYSIKDDFKGTEISLPIGVSFEPKIGNARKTLFIDLCYHLGLSKVNKVGDSMRNSAFLFSIGYVIF